MTLQVLSAETVDLPQLAVGTPPIIDVAHTCHADTTLLYVVIAASTAADSTVVPTTISAVWDQGGANQAVTQQLNNFVASTYRAVTWVGWLRAPTTGARTLRITFNKAGKGYSATFYDIAGAIGSGVPYGQVVQFRDDTVRAGAIPSSQSITPDAAGTSLLLACLSIGGNGTMTYTIPGGFTTVRTGQLGEIPGNSSGKCQQTHRYLLNASGTITVSQATASNQDRRHGILLLEILPGATSLGSTLTESVSLQDTVASQLAARRGMAEAVDIDVAAAGLVRGTGSPERPAAVWAGAANVYDPASAKEVKSGRTLTVVDVAASALSDGRPAGAFSSATTSIAYEAAPSNLALSAFTVEGWIEVTTRGRVVRLAAPGSTTSKISIQVLDSSGGSTACWVLTRTTASGVQISTSASGASVLDAPQHFAAVFPSGADAQLFVDGSAVALSHSATAPTGPLVIATGDEISLGRSNTTGHVSMVGKIARINVWPIAFSASRAAITYRHQSDAVAYVGLSGPNLLADGNRAPVAVPIIETAIAGQPKTINPRTPAYDPDGDTLSLSGTPTATGGSVAVSAGNLVYTPSPSFVGTGTLNFTLRDPGGKTSPTVARVTVKLLDAPAISLPAWPVTYNGDTYYVRAGATRTGLSGNDSQHPNSPQWMLDNAPSRSTIVFLGAGPYPDLIVFRPTDVHLKLIADVPVFSDLINLQPQGLTAGQLNTLEDIVVKDKNLTTSCQLQQLLLQAGGYIWVEGFWAKGERFNVSLESGKGRSNVVGSWFEKIHIDQAPSTNMLFIGPSNGANKLNVVHKFWCKSYNELGDPGYPGGGSLDPVGSAVTDYGVRSDVDCGAMQILECFFQMRSNHMISFKRGNGANDAAMKNRIEGCLFASWNRTYAKTNTGIEVGQECDDDSNGDTTIQDTDILDNTFADPNMVVLMPKNVTNFLFDGNRIIMHNRLMIAGITNGKAGVGKVIGPLHPSTGKISNNIIMESSPAITLYSVGTAATYTFESNTTQNLIPITTQDGFWPLSPWRFADAQTVQQPRIKALRVNGNSSGFGTVTDA